MIKIYNNYEVNYLSKLPITIITKLMNYTIKIIRIFKCIAYILIGKIY